MATAGRPRREDREGCRPTPRASGVPVSPGVRSCCSSSCGSSVARPETGGERGTGGPAPTSGRSRPLAAGRPGRGAGPAHRDVDGRGTAVRRPRWRSRGGPYPAGARGRGRRAGRRSPHEVGGGQQGRGGVAAGRPGDRAAGGGTRDGVSRGLAQRGRGPRARHAGTSGPRGRRRAPARRAVPDVAPPAGGHRRVVSPPHRTHGRTPPRDAGGAAQGRVGRASGSGAVVPTRGRPADGGRPGRSRGQRDDREALAGESGEPAVPARARGRRARRGPSPARARAVALARARGPQSTADRDRPPPLGAAGRRGAGRPGARCRRRAARPRHVDAARRGGRRRIARAPPPGRGRGLGAGAPGAPPPRRGRPRRDPVLPRDGAAPPTGRGGGRRTRR